MATDFHGSIRVALSSSVQSVYYSNLAKVTLKSQPEDHPMKSGFSRRRMMKAAGAAALLPVASKSLPPSFLNAAQKRSWPPAEGAGTPKICLGIRPDVDEAGMRRIKQIGVDYVLMGGPPIPWTEQALRERMNRFKA